MVKAALPLKRFHYPLDHINFHLNCRHGHDPMHSHCGYVKNRCLLFLASLFSQVTVLFSVFLFHQKTDVGKNNDKMHKDLQVFRCFLKSLCRSSRINSRTGEVHN